MENMNFDKEAQKLGVIIINTRNTEVQFREHEKRFSIVVEGSNEEKRLFIL